MRKRPPPVPRCPTPACQKSSPGTFQLPQLLSNQLHLLVAFSNPGVASGVSPGNGGYDRMIRVWKKDFVDLEEYIQKTSNKSKKSPLGCNGDHQNGVTFLPDCYWIDWIPLHSAYWKSRGLVYTWWAIQRLSKPRDLRCFWVHDWWMQVAILSKT